jgi:hypothetical protein
MELVANFIYNQISGCTFLDFCQIENNLLSQFVVYNYNSGWKSIEFVYLDLIYF